MVFIPLIILGILMVVVFRWVTSKRDWDRYYSWAWSVYLSTTFLLFWVNGAVGIIGASNNDANMLFNGLIGLGILGALVVRITPLGMAAVMLVLALLQLLIAVIAWSADWGASGAKWPYDLLLSSVFFIVLWTVAAGLFYLSNRQDIQRGLR